MFNPILSYASLSKRNKVGMFLALTAIPLFVVGGIVLTRNANLATQTEVPIDVSTAPTQADSASADAQNLTQQPESQASDTTQTSLPVAPAANATPAKPTPAVSPTPEPANSPSVSLTQPIVSQMYEGYYAQIRCTWNTPNGFDFVEGSVKDASGTLVGSFRSGGDGSCSSDMEMTYAANGTYIATVIVHDKTGKTASASASFAFSR